MKKFVVLAAAAAALVPSAALAQDGEAGGFKVAAVGGLDVINLEDETDSESESGLLYGLTAGYDAVSGKALIGLELEATGTTISEDLGDAGLDLYGGVRLGYIIDEDSILYVKGGYTNVDVDYVDNLEGFRAGLGYEQNFGGMFGRLEYRYSNYNISDVIASDLNGNRHQVVAAVGVAF
ncbi:porin family protein [Qipengyuania sp. 1NDH17]|uniref:Porin family protein n=1 Tax=Qipengyuania polymorpha TaxID=2867234 RepID=A0ABS7J2S1_9SPHN|nr:porin family protein [Qipengyuania polymorpha]MBX7458379.1 porin family protein [Qipengyuania polymorpha]